MTRGIPRLDTYRAPDAPPADASSKSATSPAAIEAALVELSAEMTEAAKQRRDAAATRRPA